MARRRKTRRGVSLGTVVMLTLTGLVLVGFFALLPVFTGHSDIRVDAENLAVAIDQSLSQISTISRNVTAAQPQATQKSPFVNTPVPQGADSAPTPAATAAPTSLSFSLCATGSVKLNSKVQKALTDDDGYHFELLTDQMQGAMTADLSIATLENTLIADQKLTDVNLPADMLLPLRSAGINALCLGFPNILDGGVSGLEATRQAVQSAGMTPYGAYASQQQRDEATLLNINGISVALLSYQNDLSSAGRKKTTNEERAFAIAGQQASTIASDIERMRQNGANVVVVSLCWGKAWAASPTAAQKELAQTIADAGADIILGTHSGTLQTIQVLTANRGDGQYHPVLCAYSLGNLFTYDREKRSGLAGALLKAQVVYDTATGCVAFDNLTYTATYSWRGKDNGVVRFRVLLNNGQTYPDFVDKDQQNVMERCLKLVRDALKDSPVQEQE